MSFTYGFYNSVGGDRVYDARQVSQLFDGLITDGVFSTIGGMLMVEPGDGLQVLVQTGRAWFNHTWSLNDSIMPVNLDNPDITLPRIDAIILQIRTDAPYRENSIVVVKGTPSSNPQRPTLINQDDFYMHPLAYVTVPGGATQIQKANIENVVGTDPLTPFVTGILRQQNISDIFQQWEGEFEEWFANLKLQLTEDVVANLQRQIDANKDKIEENYENTLTSDTKNHIGVSPTATPSDAFEKLYNQIKLIMADAGSMTITVKTESGKAIEGVEINNLLDPSTGNPVKTNASGIATGSISAGTTVLSISGYGDIIDLNKSYNIVKGNSYTDTFVVTTRNFLKLTSSQNIRFSNNVSKLDATVVGGGGGGGSAYYRFRGYGGGGGGQCVVQENVSFTPASNIKATIGAGGKADNNGGASSFGSIVANGGEKGNNELVQGSTGGLGGAGNGKGGNGALLNSTSSKINATAGVAGSTAGYSSYTATVVYGGGGGGGGTCSYMLTPDGGSYAFYYSGNGKGSGYGGAGASLSTEGSFTHGVDGTAGFGGGGGGAGYGTTGTGSRETTYTMKAGTGGSGCIALRMHLKVF